MSRFRSADSFARYAGFTPLPNESGNQTGKTKISKAYDHVLHQAVQDWARTAHNPKAVNVGIKAHYEYRTKVRGDRSAQAYRSVGARLIAGIFKCVDVEEAWDNEKAWPNVQAHLDAVALMPKLTAIKGAPEKPVERKARFARAAHTVGIAS